MDPQIKVCSLVLVYIKDFIKQLQQYIPKLSEFATANPPPQVPPSKRKKIAVLWCSNPDN